MKIAIVNSNDLIDFDTFSADFHIILEDVKQFYKDGNKDEILKELDEIINLFKEASFNEELIEDTALCLSKIANNKLKEIMTSESSLLDIKDSSMQDQIAVVLIYITGLNDNLLYIKDNVQKEKDALLERLAQLNTMALEFDLFEKPKAHESLKIDNNKAQLNTAKHRNNLFKT